MDAGQLASAGKRPEQRGRGMSASERTRRALVVSRNGRNRRIFLVAALSGEGPLTEPTAAAQIRGREPLFMPQRRPLPEPGDLPEPGG